MLRLGRRGIILSLFINGLNIVLYLIILVAACLNIVEASVNFIILNAFAAFGCLVASRIAFNLYGGIIVVCMGLAFFMLSYVKLIPPLDGLILNYKKLDQWKEQRHFRVQLEAQRIFEQQLQQEQNLARMIPAHHPNSLTVHAHMAVGSPKQIKAFSAINSGSVILPAGGTGTLAPPMSPLSRRPYNSSIPPLPIQQTQQQQQQQQQSQRGSQDSQFFRQQLQGKSHDLSNSGSNQEAESSQDATSIHGSGAENSVAGRVVSRPAHNLTLQTELNLYPSSNDTKSQRPRQRLQLDKSLPPISSDERGIATDHALLSPRAHRPCRVESAPGSPLQYLLIDEPEESRDSSQGAKTEWHGEAEDGILRSAPHPQDRSTQSQRHRKKVPQLQTRNQHQLPLRTTNKPAPPHDPFRRTSLSSDTTGLLSNLSASTHSIASPASSIVKSTRTNYQSLYQPPEPPGLNSKVHPLQQQSQPHHRYPSIPLTATGQILSSIGGISGCYGIAGGVLRPIVPDTHPAQATSGSAQHTCTPALSSAYSQQQQQQQQHMSGSMSSGASCQPSGALSSSAPGPIGPQCQQPPKQLQYQDRYQNYTPDIILTLPTPAESGFTISKRNEYFAM
ncbi:hypothetical protein BGZ98_005282 [Dissophora globulifera]|nr:hypothetical protein BGZ98_005282 [Dissophora globulifera]